MNNDALDENVDGLIDRFKETVTYSIQFGW